MLQDIINAATLSLQSQIMARAHMPHLSDRETGPGHVDFHIEGRLGGMNTLAHWDGCDRAVHIYIECKKDVGELGSQVVTRRARIDPRSVPNHQYVEHMTHELRDLIEDAFWARGPAPSAPAPQVSASPLEWGEVRSAVGAADYRRLLELARHLVVKGEEADPVREYCRTALDAQRGLPWPVGYHVEAMGGQQPIDRFLLPRDASLFGGGLATQMLSQELERAGLYTARPAGGYPKSTQRQARDLYRLGLEPEPELATSVYSTLPQWELIHEHLIALLHDGRWGLHWRPDMERAVDEWHQAQLELAVWMRGASGHAEDLRRAAKRLAADLVQLEAKPRGGVPLVVQRRLAGILRRGPTLNGLAYAAWALHAPLSWGDQAHAFGPAEDPNRIVVPEGSEGERWRVTGEIHRALGKLIDAVQEGA